MYLNAKFLAVSLNILMFYGSFCLESLQNHKLKGFLSTVYNSDWFYSKLSLIVFISLLFYES